MTYVPRYTYSHSVIEVPENDWAHAPDPMVHSWRWRQPEARFFVAFYEEVNAMVREFLADMRRQLFA